MLPLFTTKSIIKYADKNKVNVKSKIHLVKKWLELLDDKKLIDERNSYHDFQTIILEGILGYEHEKIHREKDQNDFQINDNTDIPILCIEAKGSNTDLNKYQNYGKKDKAKPIYQVWNYMGKDPRIRYGLCTNYQKFLLVVKNYGYNTYYEFDFNDLRNNMNKLKEFVCVFSMKTLTSKNMIEDIVNASSDEKKEITDEFYDTFHKTRRMLVDEFKNKANVSNDEAISYTQIFLNRLIFIFFVEAKEFVPKLIRVGLIEGVKNGMYTEKSQQIWKYIKTFFDAFNIGNFDKRIFAFNGGLFYDQIPNKIYFDDLKEFKINTNKKHRTKSKFSNDNIELEKIMKIYGNLNPIIRNIVKLASYDFNTQININVLGHIFERSIPDLEILHGDEKLQKKNDGIYYTPEYITDYICRHTIISHLSKNGVYSISDLIKEHVEDGSLEDLEKKVKTIKILDPACGSGAFLINAISVLVQIAKEILDYKISTAVDKKPTQRQITEYNRDEVIRKIISNNIYGVDINIQSVEITKLSIFLFTASDNIKLPKLTDKIKHGNSLMIDSKNTKNNFDWKAEFPNIFDGNNGGFDIIIGNPPYVGYKKFKANVDNMQIPIKNTLKIPNDFKIPVMSDLSYYFYYHSLNLLKNGGKLGFISTDTWMQTAAGTMLRKIILENTNMKKIIKMNYNVFEGALVKTAITIFEKGATPDNIVELISVTKKHKLNQLDLPTNKIKQNKFNNEKWIKYFESIVFTPKINLVKISDMGNVKKGLLTGYNPFFVLDENKINQHKIPRKYLIPIVPKGTSGSYLDDHDLREYIMIVNEDKGQLEKTDDGKKILKYIEIAEKTKVRVRNTNETQLIPNLYNLKMRRIWYSLSMQSIHSIIVRRVNHKFPTIIENNGKFHITDGYIGFTPKNKSHVKAYLAYMSSSYFALQMEDVGHSAGGGALSLIPNNLNDMMVPNFNDIPNKDIMYINKTWDKYRKYKNRNELDMVILKMLGLINMKTDIDELLKTRINARLGRT